MKVLIIGGGAVSEMIHIPAAIKLLGVENVLVAEPDSEQAKKIASKYFLGNLFDDYKTCLTKADFAIIATPPHLHATILMDCIDAGIPALCEKPAILNSADGKRILERNKEKNITLGMCHTYRFFPNRQYIKQQLSSGFFGEKIVVDISEGDPTDWTAVTGYNFRKEIMSGGVLIEGGIHSLDFLLWCFGLPDSVEYADDSLGGLESNASLELQFPGNVFANFRISRTCSLSNKISIKGESASAELSLFDMKTILKNGTERFETEIGKIDFNWSTIGIHQMQDFINAFSNKTKPLCTIDEGFDVIKVIEDCYKLKKERSIPVKVPFPGKRF